VVDGRPGWLRSPGRHWNLRVRPRRSLLFLTTHGSRSLPPTRSMSHLLFGAWEELSAAALPHPGKHRRSMKTEWRNEDGGRRWERFCFACLLVRAGACFVFGSNGHLLAWVLQT
jgi:hypothetical protein